MGSKATARDVAREAGVSLATVDRVLNNRGGVTAEKERAVVMTARRLRLDRSLDFRAARTLRVAVLVQPPTNPFHAALAAGIEAERQGPNPFNLSFAVTHIKPDAAPEVAATIGRVAAHADALMICASEQPKIARTLTQVARQDKPVIALATQFGQDVPHIYVGPDNLRAGRVAGDLMGRLVGAKGGDVILVAGLFSMLGHAERREGFRAVLAERHPNCRVVAEMESAEDGRRAGELVAATLACHPDAVGIYNASAGAREIGAVLQAGERGGAVTFVTHELTEGRRALLKAGVIDAIIDQDPALEIRTAVAAIAARFGRLDPGLEMTRTPVQIYMIENC